MSSILSGFEYDIFISYRHNDNRSGWVTDFVKALQEELAATIKDSVSVYFDTNPHDGLSETHDVDATNQKVKMYDALKNSIAENEIDLTWLKVDPVFEPFRNEPRFKGMLEKIVFK